MTSLSAIRNLMLADLKKSGLVKVDAERLRIEVMTGTGFAAQTIPHYRLPYFELDGKPNCFYRIRFLGDDLPVDARGKKRRYAQPADARPRFYLPALVDWQDIAANPAVPLTFTEGEKKAACATKHGIRTIGLGGVFNFLSQGKPIPDFESFRWNGREVELTFDSDHATNRQVAQAAFRLTVLLEHLGARATLVVIPPAPDGSKQGLDDFLVAHGRAAYDALPRVSARLPAHLTDLGNSERFVRQHGADLIYVHEARRWFAWNGSLMVPDTTGEVTRRCKDTVLSIIDEARAERDDTQREKTLKWATQSQKRDRLAAIESLARSALPGKMEDFDRDPFLLGTPDGPLDLHTGKLRAPERDDLITKSISTRFDPKAECPTWLRFLSEIMLRDKAMITYLQRLTGYFLTGLTIEQIMVIAYGTGANGKSVFISTLLRLLGDYGQQASPDMLMAKPTGGIPNDIARLRGARFVAAVETDDGKRLAEGLVKQLTGGDRMVGRFLHAEFFEFDSTHKVLLSTNHRPIIRGDDHAIWRRIRLIPFRYTVPPERMDKHLEGKLATELPGILNWAVAGCLDWQLHGLGEPPEVKEATGEYKAEMNLLSAWIAERCTVKKTGETPLALLYGDFKNWAEATGEWVMPRRAFARKLEEMGCRKHRGTGNAVMINGLTLVSGGKF